MNTPESNDALQRNVSYEVNEIIDRIDFDDIHDGENTTRFLVFTKDSELLRSLRSIRPARSLDRGFPMTTGTSRNHSGFYMATFEDGSELPVIAKRMQILEAINESKAYGAILKSGLPSLDVLMILEDERDSGYLVTISNPHLVSLLNINQSIKSNIQNLPGIILSGNYGSLVENIKSQILQSIMIGFNVLESYNNAGILHNDAFPKNILVDLVTRQTIVCDFDSSITQDSAIVQQQSDKERIEYINHVVKYFTNSFKEILEQNSESKTVEELKETLESLQLSLLSEISRLTGINF